MTLKKGEEIWVGKLYIDSYYHRLALPTHFRACFGSPSVLREGWKVLPQLRSIYMEWSHSVIISWAINAEIIYAEANLDVKDELRGGNLKTRMKCRFGRDIDDFFIFGKSRKRWMKAYDLVYNPFVRTKWSPKPTKCEHPENESLTISGVVFNRDVNIEPSTEEMARLLQATRMMMNARLWNTARLQHVLG